MQTKSKPINKLALIKRQKMNRLFAITIIIVMIYSCDSHTKTTDNPDLQLNSIFIIPQNETSLICKIENNVVRELGSFPKSIDSKSIVVNDKFICSIDSLISVFDIKGNLLKEIILVVNQAKMELIQVKFLRFLTLKRKIFY